MKLRKTKKGFTIVELVIVIAVIAILAAILIPTFASLTQKANRASDQSLMANLNTALRMQEAEDGEKNATMHDAVEDLKKQGFLLETITTKADKALLWDIKENQFVLESDQYSGERYWKIVDKPSEVAETNFSVYARENTNWKDQTISTNRSFDAGYNANIAKITYENSDESKSVIIRTNSVLTDLVINAPLDTVDHYGDVGKVDVQKVDLNCYNEFGDAIYVKVSEGKVVAKNGGSINIVFANNTDGNKVAVTKEETGKISSGYTTLATVDAANQARDGGVALTYSIHVDATTEITGDQFVNFVESTAEHTVASEKKVEEAVQQEKQEGPMASFPTSPFIDAGEVEADLIFEVGTEFDGVNASFGVTPYEISDELFDFFFSGDNDLCDIEDEDSLVWYFDNDPSKIESSIVDIAFSVEGEGFDTEVIFTITAKASGTATMHISVDVYDTGDWSEIDFVIHVLGDVEVIPDGPAFQVGEDSEKTFEDFESAVNAAVNGETITLLRNVVGSQQATSNNNKSLTLDLNGHTMYGVQGMTGKTALSLRNISFTIVDNSDEKTGRVDGLLSVDCSAGFYNVNFDYNNCENQYATDDYHDCVDVNGQHKYLEMWTDRPAKVTLLGGSYSNISVRGIIELEISGAKVYYVEPNNIYSNAIDAFLVESHAKVNIRSGFIVGAIRYENIGSVIISGGFFGQEVPAKYLAEGYACAKVSEGVYQVAAK